MLASRVLRRTVLKVEKRSAHEIFDSPDDRKLRSCATLFAHVTAPGSVFERLLEKHFDGERDARTLELLKGSSADSTFKAPPLPDSVRRVGLMCGPRLPPRG